MSQPLSKDYDALPKSMDDLLSLLTTVDETELLSIIDELPDSVISGLIEDVTSAESEGKNASPGFTSPVALAQTIDPGYKSRPHLDYLSSRLSQAMHDVDVEGQNRYMTVSMPPRMGKSQQISIWFPLWLLATATRSQQGIRKIGLISHSRTLSATWGREMRRTIEDNGASTGLALAKDRNAVSNWETANGSSITSRSVGQSIIGQGFNVLIVDDAVKDFAAAHSTGKRNALWDWWMGNAIHRMEPPYLVVVVGTRWHEDDFIGRLLSDEYNGDPDEWEVISFPALAEEGDALGRMPGQPLYSPLIEETEEQALARWEKMESSVGSYIWASTFQQRPAPAQGAIFDLRKVRYWSTSPEYPPLEEASQSDSVVYFDPEAAQGNWLDSWDTGMKGSEGADYSVGQRWMKTGPYRVMVDQTRGRWEFTGLLEEMRRWARPGESIGASKVHQRLIEQATNGAAAISVLSKEFSGVKPIKPGQSKEIRARVVTPEWESGHVLLPHPQEKPWVGDLLTELREFPHGRHDDQVDTLTQALSNMRDAGTGRITVPGARRGGAGAAASQPRSILQAARSGRSRGL